MTGKHKRRGLTRRRLVSALAALGLVAPAPLSVAWAQDPAERFIDVLSRRLLGVVMSDQAPEERKQAFHALLGEYADIRAIGRFSLGRYVRLLKPQDEEGYYKLLARFIAHIFSTHALNLDISAEQSRIVGSVQQDSGDAVVKTEVSFANGRTLPVEWRVTDRDGAYKVLDVGVNGIWLALQQRSEFVSIIKNGGGRIEALFDFLRQNSG